MVEPLRSAQSRWRSGTRERGGCARARTGARPGWASPRSTSATQSARLVQARRLTSSRRPSSVPESSGARGRKGRGREALTSKGALRIGDGSVKAPGRGPLAGRRGAGVAAGRDRASCEESPRGAGSSQALLAAWLRRACTWTTGLASRQTGPGGRQASPGRRRRCVLLPVTGRAGAARAAARGSDREGVGGGRRLSTECPADMSTARPVQRTRGGGPDRRPVDGRNASRSGLDLWQ
ncbi:Hypothetical protein GLP15_967 [Giardia lamblia P15]|uniref:Uncharacterized protein n=1 Tax=Giardia intestinalis (strain P15) TaxID=658858 RepID=E1EZ45_GIAIA|nr:Hypothetical protein GLP15_967 [Giardia lamblia P15]